MGFDHSGKQDRGMVGILNMVIAEEYLGAVREYRRCFDASLARAVNAVAVIADDLDVALPVSFMQKAVRLRDKERADREARVNGQADCCPKCGGHWITHDGDGACVED